MSSTAQRSCAYSMSCSSASASTPLLSASFARGLSSDVNSSVSAGSTSLSRKLPSVTRKGRASLRDCLMRSLTLIFVLTGSPLARAASRALMTFFNGIVCSSLPWRPLTQGRRLARIIRIDLRHPVYEQRVRHREHHRSDEEPDDPEGDEPADDAHEDQQQRQVGAPLDQQRAQEVVERGAE